MELDQRRATTPLDEAARNGHTKIVQALISAGADVHALDENGRTPLHEAKPLAQRCIALHIRAVSDRPRMY